MKKYLSLIMIFALTIAIIGCSNSQGNLFIRNPSFVPSKSKIVLLPARYHVVTKNGESSESVQSIRQMLVNSLSSKTDSRWLSPDQTASLVKDSYLVPKYEEIVNTYEKTGFLDRNKLTKFADDINCDYLAICNVSQTVAEDNNPTNYRQALVNLQVISPKTGETVLEVTGNAECGSGSNDIGADNLVQKAIDSAIHYYPGTKE